MSKSSRTQLESCDQHGIVVHDRAKLSWSTIPWSPAKWQIRKLCNEGLLLDFCDPMEPLDFERVPVSVEEDLDEADPEDFGVCINGERDYLVAHGLWMLRVGTEVVLYFGEMAQPEQASLRNCTVIDILRMGDMAPDLRIADLLN